MNTSQERLEFAVDLAQRSPVVNDLVKLRKKLTFFVGGDGYDRPVSGIATRAVTTPLPEDYSITDFETLRRDAYAILSDVVAGKGMDLHSPEGFDVKVNLAATPLMSRKYRSIVFADGSTRDIFRFKLFLLLGQEPANRILRCKAPDCQNIFYRRRRKAFCSTRCTNRTFMREYRVRYPSYREAEKEEAHGRYSKRMKKIHGRGRKVARRPRLTFSQQ
jgi:hypothetical protein